MSAAAARSVWHELAHPDLTGSDRVMLEILSNLIAEFRIDPVAFSAGKYSVMRGLLSRLWIGQAQSQ